MILAKKFGTGLCLAYPFFFHKLTSTIVNYIITEKLGLQSSEVSKVRKKLLIAKFKKKVVFVICLQPAI